MLIMPSFKKSLILEQFQGNYLNCSFFIYTDVVAKFFLCFSLIQNTNRIMSTKVPPGAITSINGMRVLSMWWVILGHCYAFQTMAGLPSKLFHIFITKKLPKIYYRRRNNSGRQQLFQYFKAEKWPFVQPWV